VAIHTGGMQMNVAMMMIGIVVFVFVCLFLSAHIFFDGDDDDE
jgi:hypothetical protein